MRSSSLVWLFAFTGLLFAGTIALKDVDGVVRYPLTVQGRAAVLFFITTDCPISNSYAPEIQRICQEYGPKGVGCSLIYVDPQLTIADVKKHLKEYRYSGVPAILDSTQKVVEAATATVTPQSVVIGPGGRILYRGRIDNFYAGLGKPRRQATEWDLRRALDETLSAKMVSIPETKAFGCYIPPVDLGKPSK